MRASRRSRLAWLLPSAAGVLLGWLAWQRPAPAAAGGGGGPPREGALEELAHARLEQALIRAEPTAQLLALLPAPGEPEGGP
ncbi:MAG TPA: hypothetical protein VF530_19455 [Planctomycetota bacterium]